MAITSLSSAVNAVSNFGNAATKLTSTLGGNSRGDRLLSQFTSDIIGSPIVKFNLTSSDGDDWRVKVVAKDPKYTSGPILSPLAKTGGMIFPYTPQISITHTASWAPTNPVHTNYASYEYQFSNVDNIIITSDFTAQNHEEARYCLAAIHFLRSVSKMNFGQDSDAGTPPPLLFLEGLGTHILPSIPVIILSSFLDIGPDVDYLSLNTRQSEPLPGQGQLQEFFDSDLRSLNFGPGGSTGDLTGNISRIPSQFSMNVSLAIAHSRESTSTRFSLSKFLNGEMLGSDSFGGFI